MQKHISCLIVLIYLQAGDGFPNCRREEGKKIRKSEGKLKVLQNVFIPSADWNGDPVDFN